METDLDKLFENFLTLYDFDKYLLPKDLKKALKTELKTAYISGIGEMLILIQNDISKEAIEFMKVQVLTYIRSIA